MKGTGSTAAFAVTLMLSAHLVVCDQSILANHQASVPRNPRRDITPRGLFVSKTADAMVVKVLDTKTGAALSPRRQFTRDDSVRVVIESNFEGYAYIINVEITRNSEKRFLLFPNPRAANNRIKPDEPFGLSIGFDEKAATEVLQVVVSHDRIEYLDSALNGNCSETENRCQLESQVSAQVASLVGDKKSSPQPNTAGIFPRQSVQRQNQSGLKSRDIILAPGKDKGSKETYVAIPIKSGGDGRLKSKEAVVFEVRLKHS